MDDFAIVQPRVKSLPSNVIADAPPTQPQGLPEPLMLQNVHDASGIVGGNMRDALLGSTSCAVTSIRADHAPMPHLRLPTAISPRIRLIRRGKGPRGNLGSHPKARGRREWP
jgi:hypothetical protein